MRQGVTRAPSSESCAGASGLLWRRRSRRVTMLILGIIVLSIADLAVTIAYLQANSMMEANPIAAYVIKSTQSAWALTAFKLATVAVCATLLYRLRHYPSGEAAAWCAVAVLAVMSVMWRSYSRTIDASAELILAQASVDDGRLGLP